MLFNSYMFILLFLPLSVTGYYICGKSARYELQKLWLLGMSVWFYAYMHAGYALLLAGSILVNYLAVQRMSKQKSDAFRKLFLFLGIVFNIGVLFYYKYCNFFIDNINTIFDSNISLLNLLLPVGISFITFQQISYQVDCYKQEIQGYSLLEYALYILFFPKISSGPIILFRDFLPQIQKGEKEKANYNNLGKGLYLFAMGLAKKVLIADTFAKLVTIGFDDVGALHTVSALGIMLCYSLQLYFDFSGYSDMAIGVARMFNITLPVNFASPYKARSVSDFWKRWHITLTHFFTQYVYIPLGGNRKGRARTCINVMLVFLFSGLWHGANWTFVVWGGLHGLILVLERITDHKIEKIPFVGRVFTFLFVNAAWVVFRADSLSDAGLFFSRIFVPGYGALESALLDAMNNLVEVRVLSRLGFFALTDGIPVLPLILFITGSLFMVFATKNTQERVEKLCYNGKQRMFAVALLFWSIISLSSVNVFLYSNF